MILFWGTGSGGLNILKVWKLFGKRPDFFSTNDRSLWGKFIEGIPVISPDEIREKNVSVVYITCTAVEAVKKQLLSMKIACGVLEATFPYSTEFYLSNIDYFDKLILSVNCRENLNRKKSAILDLSDGFSMSGIVDWNLQFYKIVSEQGFHAQFAVRDFGEINVESFCEQSDILINDCKVLSESTDIRIPYQYILESSCNTVVCNFAQNFFIAACYAKRKLKERIKLVLIIHNQHSIYYSNALFFSEYIDECYVISDYIGKKLEKIGFPKRKLRYLQWMVPFEGLQQNPEVNNSDKCQLPLKIGYAGRIVVEQKRIDLIISVAEELVKRNVAFLLSIAGDKGKDLEYLSSEIRRRNLQNNVIIVGYIKKADIFSFWQRQDIYLSCSDYEGHSISQVEAICAGAVPVVTDVSGVRDDITDGVNGYIVSVGDVPAIVYRIIELNKDRDKLQRMRNECIKISSKFNKNNVLKQYVNILKNLPKIFRNLA